MKHVIIIGAGIIGSATAYELSRQGVKVTVIDSDKVGKATAAAAGMICPWISKRRNIAWYELAKNGAAYYKTLIHLLKDDGEHDTGYAKTGAMKLHTDLEKLTTLQEMIIKRREKAPQIGNITLLNQQETKSRFPLLTDDYYSLHIEGAARVDGRKLCNALLQASIKHGATYIEGTATLVQENNAITGVKVGDSLIEADITIATNGVWMPELLAPLGINLGITSQKGQIIHLHEIKLENERFPIILPPNNQYIIPFENGKLVVGTTHENITQLDTNPTAGAIHEILNNAIQMAPELSESNFIEIRTGFRPATENHLPIFGEVASFKGLLLANGLGSSGLTTGPYIGKQLALLAQGGVPELNIKPYYPAQAFK